MRVVIQRVKEANVKAEGVYKSSIGDGLLILVGIEHEDNEDDALWLAKKIAGLRIFPDKKGVMNLDIRQADGELMVISQFTLHAKTKKGNRPSYIQAAPPGVAIPLYNLFVEKVSESTGIQAKTGSFGASMDVQLINSGPVTIFIDSKRKE